MNIGERAQPAAQEKRSGEGGDDDTVHVFSEEIERPAKAAVHRALAPAAFGICSPENKWDADGFGQGRNYIKRKSDGSEKDEPDGLVLLSIDDGTNIQRAREESSAY